MLEQIKEICMITILGRIVFGMQSGKKYEKISKVMLELLTVVYIVGTLISYMGREWPVEMLYKYSEKGTSEINENILDLQEDVETKIKSEINNLDIREAEDEVGMEQSIEGDETTVEANTIEIKQIDIPEIVIGEEKDVNGQR